MSDIHNTRTIGTLLQLLYADGLYVCLGGQCVLTHRRTLWPGVRSYAQDKELWCAEGKRDETCE